MYYIFKLIKTYFCFKVNINPSYKSEELQFALSKVTLELITFKIYIICHDKGYINSYFNVKFISY